MAKKKKWVWDEEKQTGVYKYVDDTGDTKQSGKPDKNAYVEKPKQDGKSAVDVMGEDEWYTSRGNAAISDINSATTRLPSYTDTVRQNMYLLGGKNNMFRPMYGAEQVIKSSKNSRTNLDLDQQYMNLSSDEVAGYLAQAEKNEKDATNLYNLVKARLGDTSWQNDDSLTKKQKAELGRANKLSDRDNMYYATQSMNRSDFDTDMEWQNYLAGIMSGDVNAVQQAVDKSGLKTDMTAQEYATNIGAVNALEENEAAKQNRLNEFSGKNSDISAQIRSMDDFAEKSQYVPDNMYGQQHLTDMWFESGTGTYTAEDGTVITADQYRDMAANSLIYDWVTYGKDPEKREELEFRTAQLGDAVGGYYGDILDAIPHIDDAEAEDFRYLYNTGTPFDRSAAMDYLYNTDITKDYLEDEAEKQQERLANAGFLEHAGMFLESVPQSVLNMIVGAGKKLDDTGFLEGFRKWLYDKTGADYRGYDEYSLDNIWEQSSGLTRGYQGEWLAENSPDWMNIPGTDWNVARGIYNAVGSGLDMAAVSALMSGAPVLNLFGKAKNIGSILSPLLMAGGSYNTQLNESLKAGKSEEDSKMDANVAFYAEALSELLPFDNIFNNSGATPWGKVFRGAASEFTGAFAGGEAQAIYDFAKYGDQSEAGQHYSELLTQGYEPNQAKWMTALKFFGLDPVGDALTEAFSAGVHTGPAAIADSYANRKAGDNIIKNKGEAALVKVAESLGLGDKYAKIIADIKASFGSDADTADISDAEIEEAAAEEFEAKEAAPEDVVSEATQIDAQGVVDAVMQDVSGQTEGDVSAIVETAVADAIDFIAEDANENGGENSENVLDTAMMVAENAMGDVSAQDAQKLKESIRSSLSNAYNTFKSEAGSAIESAKQKRSNKAKAEARAEEQRQAEADKAARREAEMKKKATEQAWKEVRAAAENAGKTADELFDLASRRAGDILYEMRQKAADAVKSHAEAEAAKQAEQNQREQAERAEEGKTEDISDFVAPQEWREVEQAMRDQGERSEESKDTLDVDDAAAVQKAEQNMREREERSEDAKDTLDVDDVDSVAEAERNMRERAEQADESKDGLEVDDAEAVRNAEQNARDRQERADQQRNASTGGVVTSEQAKTAREKGERSGKGKRSKVSPAKVGQLYRASMAKLDAQAQEVLSTAYARTLEGQLSEKGITGDAAKTISKQLADVIGGREFTPYIRNLITNNATVRQIYMDSMAKVETAESEKSNLEYMAAYDHSKFKTAPKPVDPENLEADEIKVEAEEGDTAAEIVTKNAAKYLDEQAVTMEAMYNAGTQDAVAYSEAFVRAVNYGRDGRNLDVVKGSVRLSALTADQVQAAYTIGQEMRRNAPTAVRVNSKGVTVGKVDLKDIYMGSLNKHQRSSVYAATRLAKAIGFNIKFVESKANALGQYTTENGSWDARTMTLTLDVHAGSNGARDAGYAMMHTMGHELTHFIKQFADGGMWNDYQAMVMDHLSTKMSTEMLDDEIAKLMKNQPNLTRDGAIEEIIAEASVEALNNITEADLAQIADTNPGLLKKIGQFIQKWVKDIKAAIKAAYSDTESKTELAKAMEDQLDEFSKKWNQLLVNAAQNRRAAEAKGEAVAKNAKTTQQAVQEVAQKPAAQKESAPTGQELTFNHIDRRTFDSVKENDAGLFCAEAEEAQVAYAAAAKMLLADAENSIPGEKFFTPDGEVTGQKRQTSDMLARIKDETGLTWDRIKDILQQFVGMDDAATGYKLPRNTVNNRRMELYLDEVLTEGYKALGGTFVAPSEAYVQAKAQYEGSTNAGMDVRVPKDAVPFEEYAYADVKYQARGTVYRYSWKQYNSYAWATDNGVLSPKEVDAIESINSSRKHGGKSVGVISADGFKVIEIGKVDGIHNVVAVTDTVVGRPNIMRVYRIKSEYETFNEIVRDDIYEYERTVGKDAPEYVKNVWTDEFVKSDSKEDYLDLYDHRTGRSRSSGIAGSEVDQKTGGLHNGERSAEDAGRNGSVDNKKFQMRSPVEATKDLIAVHNITEDKLSKALRLGGFPMPSIAVAKTDIGHQTFGNISLVFGSNTIDPKANKRNKVYSADAWTPTFPRIEYEVDSEADARVYRKLNSLKSDMDEFFVDDLKRVMYGVGDLLNSHGGEEGFVKYALDNYGLKAAYLEDSGKHAEVIQRREEQKAQYSEKQAEIYTAIENLVGLDNIHHMPMSEIFAKYADAIEDIYPGSTNSRMRFTRVLQNVAGYFDSKDAAPTYKTVTDTAATRKAIDDSVDAAAFEGWVRELYKGIEGASGVYNGKDIFTSSGNRRSFASTHYPVSVEGIAKAMYDAHNGDMKNVSVHYDAKTMRAATAKSFKSIDEMHKNKGRLRARTQEEADALTSELDNRLNALVNEILSAKPDYDKMGVYDQLVANDQVQAILQEIAGKRYSAETIKTGLAKYGYNVSDGIAQEMNVLLDDISEMPVNIFEAKPERAVYFDEVKYAIVPDSMDAGIRAQLEAVVPDVRVYNDGNESQRLDLLNAREDLKFQQRDLSNISDRELLVQALEGELTEAERDHLNRYKARVDELGEKQMKLEALNSKIVQLQAEGKTAKSSEELRAAQANAKTLRDSIARVDAKLAQIESARMIQEVVKRNRAEARKSAYALARERADERQRKAVEHAREVGQRKVERVKESHGKEKYKAQILKDVKKLHGWLTTPSMKGSVPQFLQKPVAQFLESIDFTSARALKGGEATKSDAKFADALEQLRRAVGEINKQQGAIEAGAADFAGYIDLPADYMAEFDELVGKIKVTLNKTEATDIPFNRMTADQLHELSKIFRILNSSISKTNRLIANGRYESAKTASNETIDDMNSMKAKLKTNKALESLNSIFNWKNTTPYYAFQRLGRGGKAIFEGLQDGWDKMARNSATLIDFAKDTFDGKESKEWSRDVSEVTLSSGDVIQMTTAQKMSLYCHSKRAQSMGHLLGGGIRMSDIDGKRGATISQVDNYVLSEADIRNIIGSLTARQIEVADALQKFMNTTCKDWGNEISMKRFGFEQMTEDNYFPIETDANNRARIDDTKDGGTSMFRLLNMSALKPLTPKANNAIIIRNIFDVFSDHSADMAKYNALALPILDYIKWYNYVERTDVVDASGQPTGQIKTRSTQKALERAYGVNAKQYLNAFIKDLNAEHDGGRNDGLINKLIGKAKAASVGANLRVYFLQITSLPRAAYAINPKYLMKGLLKLKSLNPANAKNGTEAQKDIGILQWKDLGFYSTDINNSVRDLVKRDGGVLDKVREAQMAPAGWGDNWVGNILYEAAKAEMADRHPSLKPGSDAYNKMLNKRVREIVYKTQVVDSTMTRSDFMRSKGLSTMLTAFMSEPTLTVNMLNEGIQEAIMKKRGLTSEDLNPTGKIARSATTFAVVAFLTAAVEAVFDGMRDDDDYEEFFDKYRAAFGGNVLDNVNVFNMLPYIKDIISIMQGYENNSMITQAWQQVKDFQTAIDSWKEGKRPIYSVIYNGAKAASSLSGFALGNAMRDFTSLYNTFIADVAGTTKLQTYEDSKSAASNAYYAALQDGDADKAEWIKQRAEINGVTMGDISAKIGGLAKEDYISGNISEEEAVRMLMEYGGKDEDDAYWKIREWEHTGEDSYSKYTGLREALANGDRSAASTAYRELVDHGVEEKTIASELTKLYNSGEATSLLNLQMRSKGLYTSNLKLKTDGEKHPDDFDDFITAIVNGSDVSGEIRSLYNKGYTFKQCMSAINGAFGNTSDRYRIMEKYNSADARILLDRILDAYEALGLDRDDELAWIEANWTMA